MEVLKFNESSWWAWFTCHHPSAVEAIAKAPGFNPEQLEVTIVVNGVECLAKPFDTLMDELVRLGVAEEIEKRGLHSIQEAAVVEATRLLKDMGYHNMLNKLDEITSSANSIVKTFYDAPFNESAAQRMRQVLAGATVNNDGKEKYQSFTADVLVENNLAMGNGSYVATGYGADEGEARKNLASTLYHLLGVYTDPKV